MQKLQEILELKFGLENFRESQEDIIKSVIDKQDTLVFMPTWWWKSLTYQLPGVYFSWITLVISPLISLMKDQVDSLNQLWIRAEFINSTIDNYDKKILLNDLSDPSTDIKFLYIAPERLNSWEFLRVVQKIKISLVVIDEAHCISQWGHDFRPSYMKIRWFLEKLKSAIVPEKLPIIGLTATATQKVREDIVDKLWLDNFNSFTSGFDRKNITIIVREISKKEEKLAKVMEVIEKTPWSWIIYCASRKAVKELYDMLLENNVSVWKYTWAMTPDLREVEQNNFMQSKYKVIVATNAFGMWIDKKDIRFVIHYNLPGSIENYYQEVWRAWRDWKKSFWIVIASFWDTKIQEFFIDNTYPSKEEILKLYDCLYRWDKAWEWKWKVILKTQMQLASESWINSDMKVWAGIKVLEKYWILNRWVESSKMEEWFRGRWLTLAQEKKKHSSLSVDWNHQDLLKEESYYKLEQIKKLLFYPSCRKRFILNYFQDKQDLEKLWDNCWTCDYCVEKKNLEHIEMQDFVNTSIFALVLDTVKKNDERIWVVMMTKFLRGSNDAKIIEWNMHKREWFWALSDLTSELVQAVIESLISLDYLYKSEWKFPLLWITESWKVAIVRDFLLKDDNKELQQFIKMRLWSSYFKKNWATKEKKVKKDTYKETFKLLKDEKNQKLSWSDLVKQISKDRELKTLTIETHIVKLYEIWELWLWEIMKFSSFSKLMSVKNIINDVLNKKIEQLKPVKQALEDIWKKDITYFDIKIAIAMMDKKDI